VFDVVPLKTTYVDASLVFPEYITPSISNEGNILI
jgi:hypothetical protein